MHPPSRCPFCGAAVRPKDNVPLLSFLILRGRCRDCHRPISVRYPLVEASTGLLFLWIAVWYGPTPRAVFFMVFALALLILSLIDLDHQLLPDVITIPGVVFGLAGSLTGVSGVPWMSSAFGAVGGYLAFAMVARLYRRSRGVEGLGQGDWKMAAMLGATLGWRSLLLVVLLASLSGTLVGVGLMVFRRRSSQQPLPFGTFLGFAGALTVFFGEPILSWYATLFRG